MFTGILVQYVHYMCPLGECFFFCFFEVRMWCEARWGPVSIFFALFVDGIVKAIEQSGHGCRVRFMPVSIFLYADDIVLLSPSVTALHDMIFICERELKWLDMALNPKSLSASALDLVMINHAMH